MTANYTHSTLRERIVEHVFVGDALRALWQRGVRDVEVLRSEFDAHGYDLVMARGSIIRHIQLKTGTRRPAKVSLSRTLAEKPSGCAVWIQVDAILGMGPYLWFGDLPGSPLPTIRDYPNTRRATHNKYGVRPLRQNHHDVPGSRFLVRDTVDEILVELFGDLTDPAEQQAQCR